MSLVHFLIRCDVIIILVILLYQDAIIFTNYYLQICVPNLNCFILFQVRLTTDAYEKGIKFQQNYEASIALQHIPCPYGTEQTCFIRAVYY